MSSMTSTTGGIGYGGDAQKDKKARNAGKKKAAKEETKRAGEQQQFLKSSHKKLTANQPPDAELISTIREVLRNQVPNEWSKKRKLHEAALECCQLISIHHPKMLGASDDDEAVMAALEEFAQHADLISKHDQTSNPTDKTFITKILNVRQAAFTASKAVLERPEMSVMDPHEHYRQALRPLRFELVETLKGHTYANKPLNSKMEPRRLFRELTTYKSSLPIEYGSSIFVRAMENRLDLLRACITGPDDTPYANGAFVFDIYLGDYPRNPPLVKYLTTGGGQYRFNPNLYQDGKVCLSLLGTWSGPGWVSGESTLLQVLISIQSLILVNDPYFNEPGYQASQGTPHGTAASNKYNASIRQYATSVCILPFMAQPCPYPEFDQAMERHFRNKRSLLQKQLFRWYSEDRSLERVYSQCLDALEATQQQTKMKSTRSVAAALLPPRKVITTITVNGVIEIDESDDEEGPATKKPKVGATTEGSAGDAIILDDDEEDAKPAAKPTIALDDSHQHMQPLPANGSNDVVDLT